MYRSRPFGIPLAKGRKRGPFWDPVAVRHIRGMRNVAQPTRSVAETDRHGREGPRQCMVSLMPAGRSQPRGAHVLSDGASRVQRVRPRAQAEGALQMGEGYA
ncbi:hypothetical protein GCM10010289_25530 [Streptomyces violascens]|uniref:Uncharacterized protein n=1 Tax=Streptomyces violascens TaxID=67381 RepID=A0ABQ3QI49_9ACTN|nr:hypothetical protein GCM10010289_25530 [Streptomyces violascens]GHI36920.1 hypothetical protein Sviol_13280 [Streptomyces violascens]